MSDHYFSAAPGGAEERRSIRVRVGGRELSFQTAGGVFSSAGLDLGTSVLLRAVPMPTSAERLLDLGCGWGPIAIALALHCRAATVDAVDVNERTSVTTHTTPPCERRGGMPAGIALACAAGVGASCNSNPHATGMLRR